MADDGPALVETVTGWQGTTVPDALARRIFGKKSEQLDPAQLQMLFQELQAPGPALGNESGPQATETEPARPNKASPRPLPGAPTRRHCPSRPGPLPPLCV